MTTPIDPDRGDDLMAIANAVTGPEPIHPSLRAHLTDEVLAATLADWSADADAPVPYLPTDHDVCHGCGDILCACEQHCMGLAEDVCGHNGRPHCPSCAPHYCQDCRAERGRWDYDPENRGSWS